MDMPVSSTGITGVWMNIVIETTLWMFFNGFQFLANSVKRYLSSEEAKQIMINNFEICNNKQLYGFLNIKTLQSFWDKWHIENNTSTNGERMSLQQH